MSPVTRGLARGGVRVVLCDAGAGAGVGGRVAATSVGCRA